MKGRGKDKKGRSHSGPPFVQLPHWLLDSPAYRALTPSDRSVYTAVRRLYNGSNNGRIGLGARRAAEMAGISKNTSCKCFAALVEKGFLECATPGGFSTNSRHQTEWRLTDQRCDVTGHLPSKAFVKWRRDQDDGSSQSKTKSQSRDAQVPKEGQSRAHAPVSVPALVPKAESRAA